MRLTIGQVFGAMQALHTVISDRRREIPQLGKFRLARMHTKLLPEFAAANAQREELIEMHGTARDGGGFEVLPESAAAFNAAWKPIADATVDVDVEPIRLGEVSYGDPTESRGGLDASEIVLLGELVTE